MAGGAGAGEKIYHNSFFVFTNYSVETIQHREQRLRKRKLVSQHVAEESRAVSASVISRIYPNSLVSLPKLGYLNLYFVMLLYNSGAA